MTISLFFCVLHFCVHAVKSLLKIDNSLYFQNVLVFVYCIHGGLAMLGILSEKKRSRFRLRKDSVFLLCQLLAVYCLMCVWIRI